MELRSPVSDEALLKAIALLTSPVFGSLSVAHALGGGPSEAWSILETFTPGQIADEIAARGLSLDGVKAACCDVLVVDSPVTHWMFQFDPRPRCPLCCCRHYVDKRTNEPLSCGDTQGFRNPPEWRWTKTTMRAAVEGTYQTAGRLACPGQPDPRVSPETR